MDFPKVGEKFDEIEAEERKSKILMETRKKLSTDQAIYNNFSLEMYCHTEYKRYSLESIFRFLTC